MFTTRAKYRPLSANGLRAPSLRHCKDISTMPPHRRERTFAILVICVMFGLLPTCTGATGQNQRMQLLVGYAVLQRIPPVDTSRAYAEQTETQDAAEI
ncbi:hypothetical protein AAVH_29376, partial [Aphelenchoides avenae]